MNTRPSGADVGLTDGAPLPPLTWAYLLVMNIPLFRTGGSTVAGHLWFKDLVTHVEYLRNLTMACPVLDASPSEVSVPLSSDDRFASLKIAELPAANGFFAAVLALPRTIFRFWKAVGNADIVHAGIAGWPMPYGWIVTPIARIRGKKLVIIVESAPWRLNAGRTRTLKSVLTASVYETLARWCVGRADLAIFTQENYRTTLLRKGRSRGHIIQASWIDEDVVISDAAAFEVWQRKLSAAPAQLKILFAGRLDRQKGLAVLIDAMRLVAGKDLPVRLDVLGSGELAAMCADAGRELTGRTRIGMLGTVAYGAPLFQLLREYHAVVVPIISDEQPRIVYDAYSQGVPVLATRTTGLQACVIENRTGWMMRPDDAPELAHVIERAAENLGDIAAMGMEALSVARSMTHQQMHRVRHRLLLDMMRSTPV